MASKKTVLILGAGASYEYGLPTAAELKSTIYPSLKVGRPLWQTIGGMMSPFRMKEFLEYHWTSNEGDRQTFESFYSEYKDSSLVSIDRFVHFRPEYRDVASFVTAILLLYLEQRHKLNNGWYSYLFDNITYPGGEWREGQLSIINFNYDRSLNEFLTRSFASINQSQNFSLFKECRAYGSLGSCEYGSRHSAKSASGEINFIRFGGSATDELTEMLKEAENIAFLGFGFDDMNMNYLGFSELPDEAQMQTKSYFSSAVGLSAEKQNQIKSRIPTMKFGSRSGSGSIIDTLSDSSIFT